MRRTTGRRTGRRPTAWEVDRLLATVNDTIDVDLTRGRRRRHVRRAPAAARAVRWLDRQGLARAPGDDRRRRRRAHRRRQVHDLPGHGPRRRRRRARARRRPPPAERDRRAPAHRRGGPARPGPPRPASSAPTRRIAAAHPEAAARLVARHGTEARAVRRPGRRARTCSGRSCRVDRSSRRRWRGPPAHELAASVDDVLSRRLRLSPELPDRGAAVAPRVAAILGARAGLGCRRARPARRRRTSTGPPRVRGGRAGRLTAVDRGDVIDPSRPGAILPAMPPSATSPTTSPARCTSSASRRHRLDRRCRRRRARGRPSARLVRRRPPPPGPDRRPRRGGLRPWPCPSAGTSGRRSSSARRWSRRCPSAAPHRHRTLRRRRPRPAPRRRRLRAAPTAAPTRAPTPVRADDRGDAASSRAPTTSTSARGTASIVEVEPGRFHLRLEDFSVRNGPDLYVYLSPLGGRLDGGRPRARDAQGDRRLVRLRPARGRRSGDVPERHHLVQAVQPPVRDRAVRGPERAGTKVQAVQPRPSRVPSRLANATEASVART